MPTKLIFGRANKHLIRIAQESNLEYIIPDVQVFANGEILIHGIESLYKENTIVVQSTSIPVHDNFMELLLLLDAVKMARAKHITALIPYLGYSRHDKPVYAHGSVGFNAIAKAIQNTDIDQLITVDLHNKLLEQYFKKIPIHNIDPSALLVSRYDKSTDIVVVAPDRGSITRACQFSNLLNAKTVFIDKQRMGNNTCIMKIITGEVTDKTCVIVDDIIDTGSTICAAANLLNKLGAKRIEVVVTHAVLSEGAINNLVSAPISKITVTNSINQEKLPSKFVVIDIGSWMVSVIKDRC